MNALTPCSICREPAYACKGHAPRNGVPRDLFPNGVPLRGELSPEQQAWLSRRR